MILTKKNFFSSLLFSIVVLFLFNACRYKDNKNISLLSVKKRLCRTWQLKEAFDQGNNFDLIALNSKLLNEELTFEKYNGDTLIFKTSAIKMGLGCVLKNRKTEIYYGLGTDPHHLTITKLTSRELWLEGNATGGICYTCGLEQNVKLKYIAK
jgi:hypothetical protein